MLVVWRCSSCVRKGNVEVKGDSVLSTVASIRRAHGDLPEYCSAVGKLEFSIKEGQWFFLSALENEVNKW